MWVIKLNLIKTMRKVFALLTLAGALAVASCGGSTEGTTDTTAADTTVLAPASEVVDSLVDSAKTVVDSIVK